MEAAQHIQAILDENKRLKEQVDLLTTALAEAMVICAKWSGVPMDSIRDQFERECG